MKTGLRKSGKLAGGFGLLLALALTISLAMPALAVPQSPHQFYGSVTICGTPVEPGTVVSALIDGVAYPGSTTVVDADGKYGIDPVFKLPADDTDPGKTGGVDGDPVEFWVLGRLAGEAVFDIDATTELNLQVTEVYLEVDVVGNGDVEVNEVVPGSYPAEYTFDCSTEVDLEAVPATGWEFDGWSGDLSGDTNPTSISMDGDKSVTATFTEVGVTYYDLTVTADPEEGGTVTGAGTYDCCTDAPITATEEDGWDFVEWTGAGIDDPNSASTTVHIDGDKTVTATFIEEGVTYYDLTVTADPEEGGTVTGAGSYEYCTNAPITATAADPCWYFVEWTGAGIDDPNSASTTVHIDGDKTVTAHFAKYQYDLTVTADPEEGGTVTGTGTYDCCTDAPITATEAVGWYFVEWTGEDIDDPNSASTTVHIDGDKTVTATFTQITYDLTMVVVGDGTATPPSGTYPEGDMTITAAADPGWRFAGWSTDDMAEIADPNAASTTLTLDKDKTVTATFTERTGFTTELGPDWNLLSTPILLGDDSDSLGQIFDPESRANIEIYYSWDAVNEIWVQVLADYELLPLFAIYVKVSADASAIAEFIPSEELSWPMSRDLERGLNLIGPAPAIEDGVFPATPLDEALVSIAEAEGGLTGYTMVISPDHNQPPWTYPPWEIKELLPYKGYWVVLENDDTLFGYSWTPIP
jgi:uncharacterized repeat protein (TIGR02543 family)